MPFVISAHFLMDTYQGSDDTGQPEAYPSPERLYKALVSVAHTVFGFHAASSENERHFFERDIAAVFQWFEQNPPDAIHLPGKMRRNSRRNRDVIAYRDKGYWDKGQSAKTIEKVDGLHDVQSLKESRVGIATAYDDIDGNLVWQWSMAPDKQVCDTISALCWEVPYLGEACSPVVLHAREMKEEKYPLSGSLILDKQPLSLRHASLNEEFQIPEEGHLRELEDAYAKVNPHQKARKVAFSENEKTVVSNTLTQHVRNVGYLRPDAEDDSSKLRAPWSIGIFIPVEVLDEKKDQWRPRESQYVAWCVALHRLLVRLGGFGVTPVLTGKYEPDIERPANNVAIQILRDGDLPIDSDVSRRMGLPGFLVMVPRDAAGSDISTIVSLCESLRGRRLYYSKHFETLRLGKAVTDIDLSQFWEPVRPGFRRLWSPSPFCLRETRPIPNADPTRRWRAREDIALAVGHVWRDAFQPDSFSSKEEEYWGFVNAVLAADSPVRVSKAWTVARTQMGDYAHRTDSSVPLLGAMASLDLDLKTEREVAAIGQSRHLGGGLLVPVDYPERLAEDIVRGGERR
ncbi:type I-U CRISPR-associated protein Csb2 [Bifidobacterium sp. ESL0769]|uniref:type I-G CRISPR-associated protein Csb2 n=1 Tax=Bifidobacterium sp. ESL0769 TaxID=2983229 RepID=UPI0023F67821|nr:type I-U CRISPR-associated protein Csb2 [Bifidobacterium sp. ESL0769]WEV66815.1 type I-U CRISPR-associated protein Csb2 [Bifidobacterium sp. ESL0769]